MENNDCKSIMHLLFKKLNEVFKSVVLNIAISFLFVGEKMAVSAKKVGLYGAVGFLVAALIIGGIAIAGFNIPAFRLPGIVADKGTLIIKIMDKPVELKHLNITIDLVKIKGQNENWTDLNIKGGALSYFDLLALQDVTETLSETQIPAGNYTMIKMHVLTANATYLDGTPTELNVPSDVIKVVFKPHLKIEANGYTTVLIDLQPDDLKSIALSRNLNLRPVIRDRVGG